MLCSSHHLLKDTFFRFHKICWRSCNHPYISLGFARPHWCQWIEPEGLAWSLVGYVEPGVNVAQVGSAKNQLANPMDLGCTRGSVFFIALCTGSHFTVAGDWFRGDLFPGTMSPTFRFRCTWRSFDALLYITIQTIHLHVHTFSLSLLWYTPKILSSSGKADVARPPNLEFMPTKLELLGCLGVFQILTDLSEGGAGCGWHRVEWLTWCLHPFCCRTHPWAPSKLLGGRSQQSSWIAWSGGWSGWRQPAVDEMRRLPLKQMRGTKSFHVYWSCCGFTSGKWYM